VALTLVYLFALRVCGFTVGVKGKSRVCGLTGSVKGKSRVSGSSTCVLLPCGYVALRAVLTVSLALKCYHLRDVW
jgi:hypothetical protein